MPSGVMKPAGAALVKLQDDQPLAHGAPAGLVVITDGRAMAHPREPSVRVPNAHLPHGSSELVQISGGQRASARVATSLRVLFAAIALLAIALAVATGGTLAPLGWAPLHLQ